VKIRRRRSSGIWSGIIVRLVDDPGRFGRRVHVELLAELHPPPDPVDGLVPGGLDDPGARSLGNAGGGPLIDRRGKRLLRRVFRDVEIADLPDQGGDDAPPVRPIDGIDGSVSPLGVLHGR
jgi:hypothetical protein